MGGLLSCRCHEHSSLTASLLLLMRALAAAHPAAPGHPRGPTLVASSHVKWCHGCSEARGRVFPFHSCTQLAARQARSTWGLQRHRSGARHTLWGRVSCCCRQPDTSSQPVCVPAVSSTQWPTHRRCFMWCNACFHRRVCFKPGEAR